MTLVVGMVVGSVLLAGCRSDADPEPKVSPTESSSVTPTPTPTGPVEPTLPAEAEGDDAAAAEAFVRFYWDLVNYAQATGDVGALREVASETCEACLAGLKGIEEVHSAGGSIEGGDVSVSSARAEQVTSREGRAFTVQVSTEVSPQQISEPNEEPRRFAGGPVQFQFIVRNQDGIWSVMRLDVDQ
ncbi:MAG TPA: DUF6318 family protein [Nocardioides sp.]|uniref:DUF6318 family protein n=1 Tax=Nocardioides sp. TaxID=35761 RepID=UPI002D0E3BE3|nr:DUF6318 family protein [Nocardioides sp.]HTW16333.1 DUF6318 family protein [Nocardioides sp.]